MRKGMGGHQSARAESVIWLTPPEIIKALGPFDLDPCAAPSPRPWPTAARHIELPDDGLRAKWSGRIWLNPPYGRFVEPWLEKLIEHGSGIALVFARTDTEWFRPCVWERAQGALFLHGRLHFHHPDGRRAKHNSGAPSVLVAYSEGNARCLEASGLPGQFINLNRGVFG